MDWSAFWTAVGAVSAVALGVVGVILADNRRLRRENDQLRALNTDYLLRMADADHRWREAEQAVKNMEASRRIHDRREAERGNP